MTQVCLLVAKGPDGVPGTRRLEQERKYEEPARASAKQHVHGYAKGMSDVCNYEADLEAVGLEHFMSCLRKCRGQDPTSRHAATRPEAARVP